MKKTLFFIILMLSVSFKSQSSENDSDKLISIVRTLGEKQDQKTIDSLKIELNKLKESTNPVVKLKFSDVQKLLIETEENNATKVYSKSLSDLSKEDLKGFKIDEDKFKDVVFISPKQMPKIYAYISIKKGTLNLRLYNRYSNNSWIFWKKAIFLYDGKKFEYSDDNTDTNVYTGGVSETSDVRCTPEMIEALNEISKSNKVDVRLDGVKGVYDFTLTQNIKDNLSKIIDLYYKLKK